MLVPTHIHLQQQYETWLTYVIQTSCRSFESTSIPREKRGVCRYFGLSNLQRPITPVSLSMNASPWRAVSLDHPPKCRCIAPLPTGSCFNIKTIYPGTRIFIIKIRLSHFVMAIYVLITHIIWRYDEKTIHLCHAFRRKITHMMQEPGNSMKYIKIRQ